MSASQLNERGKVPLRPALKHATPRRGSPRKTPSKTVKFAISQPATVLIPSGMSTWENCSPVQEPTDAAKATYYPKPRTRPSGSGSLAEPTRTVADRHPTQPTRTFDQILGAKRPKPSVAGKLPIQTSSPPLPPRPARPAWPTPPLQPPRASKDFSDFVPASRVTSRDDPDKTPMGSFPSAEIKDNLKKTGKRLMGKFEQRLLKDR